MIHSDETACPKCGGRLFYYDRVKRLVRTKHRESTYIHMRRFRCEKCKSTHREFPEDIFPYKQYEREIIQGVLEGLITSDTLGFEDFPCEITMIRWRSQSLQLLLWKP